MIHAPYPAPRSFVQLKHALSKSSCRQLPWSKSSTPSNRVFTSLARRKELSSSHIRPSLLHRHTLDRPIQFPRATFTLAELQQSRDHSGHSHHHHHGHSHGPDPFLTSKDKTDPGVRITRIGLYVNFAMVITKGIGGWVFNSQALVADAFHALTDMVSDIMTLATVSFALKPPTDRFPNGYGKIESLGSLGVSSLLLLGGMAMGYGSLLHLIGDFAPALAHYLPNVHAHDHLHAIPSLNAAWLALASIGAKEWLYKKTMKIAIEKKSSVLASNAVHHRVDSLTAIVALVAIAGSNIFPGASWLDPVGGLLVAAMVVQAGAGNTRAALEELADAGIEDEVKRDVTKRVVGVGEEVVAVDGIKSGQNYLLTVTISADETAALKALDEIERKVRDSVADVAGMWKVHVRFVGKGAEAQSEFVKLNKKDN